MALADRRTYDAPGAGAAQRCLWCGRESSGTRGRRSALVPVPAGMRAWLAVHAPELCHAQLGATEPSWWWCRSVPGCIRRQGGAE